jgi:hypothetical protein
MNKILDSWRIKKDLNSGYPLSIMGINKSLTNYRPKGKAQLKVYLSVTIWGEEIQNSLHRLIRIRAVEGSQAEVACFGKTNRRIHHLCCPNLSE